jgi:integrase
MSKTKDCILSKNTWIYPKPELPGVWRCRDGGFLIRSQPKSPLTGRKEDIRRVVDAPDAATAFAILQEEISRVRNALVRGTPAEIPIFKSYAARLFREKVTLGKIKSAATRELWESTLRLRLFKAKFANFLVTAVLHQHIKDWIVKDLGPLVRSGEYSPITANTWIAKLETIVNAYVHEYHLPINPMEGIEYFDESEHGYSIEDPNSLTPDELRLFLEKMEELYPQFVAFAYLGFFTGLRPSHIRPLRRSGLEADVLWEKMAIVIRRSHSRKQEIMRSTKTGLHQHLSLPNILMERLEWHVERLPWPKQRTSDLLFPSRRGTLCSRSVLDKPFQEVCEALKLGKEITPRGMRRTANDLCRLAKIDKEIKKAVTGHQTEKMEHLYSTIGAEEMREAMTAVIQLVHGSDITPNKPQPPESPSHGAGGRGHLKLVK